MLNRILSIKSHQGVTMLQYPLIAALAMLNKIFDIKSQKGVTMIEYALIAALIAVVVIAGITALGTNLNGLFNYVAGKVTTP